MNEGNQGTPLPYLKTLIAALLLLIAACQGPPSKESQERPPFSDDEYPVGYSLGTFDPRFGISRQDFLKMVDEAKNVWERSAGRPLFRYDSSASFRVNLVFDERQQRTIDAKKLRASIDSKGRSYDALVWQHTRRSERLKESQQKYDDAAASLQRRLDGHNSRVTYWNERGGAPSAEFSRLNDEQGELARAQAELERMRAEVNDGVAAVNDLVEQINEIAAESNLDVTYFKGKFVESREFEQGVFTGRDITIYQFAGPADLRIALVHEFGHALGFNHVDDPAAIMYYRMGQQDMSKPTLSAADLALLRKKFSGN